MSVDRSIRLDVSVPDMGPRAGEGFASPGGRQGQPDAQTRQRFEQALAGPTEVAMGEDAPQVPQPFALFGQSAWPPAVAASDSADLALDTMLSRLMVGEGRSGGSQVRMELQDEVLPGVTVVIEEAEGRLQVDFICSVETSRLRLNAALPQQAPELALRLDRDVLLRVQTDDEEDPCLFEVAASP